MAAGDLPIVRDRRGDTAEDPQPVGPFLGEVGGMTSTFQWSSTSRPAAVLDFSTTFCEHSARTSGCLIRSRALFVIPSLGSGAMAKVSHTCFTWQSARLTVMSPEMSVMPLQHSAVVTQRPPTPSTAAAGQFSVVVDAPPKPAFLPGESSDPPLAVVDAAEEPPGLSDC